MRVTVCQLCDDPAAFETDWIALADHVRIHRSDLVLLPEMPFARWFAATRPFDANRWRDVLAAHALWEQRIGELGAPAVVVTRPTERGGRRFNEAIVFTPDHDVRGVHDKRYLPDEDGYWEASWYAPGDGAFDPFLIGDAAVGAQICTEMWMLDVSRHYGLRGADIIVVPRATPEPSRDRWLVGGRAAAIVSGAYCLSSNRCGSGASGDTFGGLGWIVDPDGDVLGVTTDAEPFVTRDVDLARAREAKQTYPRYVR